MQPNLDQETVAMAASAIQVEDSVKSRIRKNQGPNGSGF